MHVAASYTPLMVASCSGGDFDVSLVDEANGSGDSTECTSPGIISDLLARGADVNAQTDMTGTVGTDILQSIFEVVSFEVLLWKLLD